jgi:hypothetical protein
MDRLLGRVRAVVGPAGAPDVGAARSHPVLRHRQGKRPKLSMAGLCCYRPDGSAAELVWSVRDGSYDTDVGVPRARGLGAGERQMTSLSHAKLGYHGA